MGATPRGPAGTFDFGPFRLDAERRALYRAGDFVPITPKAADTLLLLVEEAGRVVSKAELLERVWPDVVVEEGNVTNNISTLRKVLNPHFDGLQPIVTVARRGYRFIAEVRRRDGPPLPVAPALAPPAAARRAAAGRALPAAAALLACATLFSSPLQPRSHAARDRRALVVLPLKDLGDRPESRWLGTALAETIGSELMASGQLRLVSAESVAQHGSELVLSGNYLVKGGRLRLDLRLVDAVTGEHLATLSATRPEDELLDLVSLAGSELRAQIGLAPVLAGQTAPSRALASDGTHLASASRP